MNPTSPPMPEPDLQQVIATFGMQALMAVGRIPNPVSGKTEVNLPMARYHIGVLLVLREKTRNNLTADERSHLEETLHQTQLAYTQAAGQRGATP